MRRSLVVSTLSARASSSAERARPAVFVLAFATMAIFGSVLMAT
jgi:hypothetical protein